MYVCIYIYIYLYISISIYISIHIYVYIYIIYSATLLSSFIPKPSCGSGALGWVLFTAAQCGVVGFVPVSVDSVPFDYCEAPAQW